MLFSTNSLWGTAQIQTIANKVRVEKIGAYVIYEGP